MFAFLAGSAKARVARGVEWLDVVAPGWAMNIDDLTLNMADPRDCILGQTFGVYDAGLARAGFHFFDDGGQWAARHGFSVKVGPKALLEFMELEVEWLAVLNSRRGAEILAA